MEEILGHYGKLCDSDMLYSIYVSSEHCFIQVAQLWQIDHATYAPVWPF